VSVAIFTGGGTDAKSSKIGADLDFCEWVKNRLRLKTLLLYRALSCPSSYLT